MTDGMGPLPHLATRVFGTPLLITRDKLDVILRVLGPRLGLGAEGESVQAPGASASAGRPPAAAAPPLGQAEARGVAVIPVHGTLVQRAAWVDTPSGLTGYDVLRARFAEALADPAVTAILFDVDSPGGEVAGLFDLVDEIYRARGRKPIYAVADEAAYSAAYAIASAADRVFLPRTGGVGSVGVIALHVDQSGFDEKTGLRYTAVYAGARKNDFNPHEPLSGEARATLQAMVDETYEIFVATVARNRGLSADAVRRTEAGVYQGRAAVSAGLADGVRSVREVLAEMAGRKGVKAMETEERKKGAAAAAGEFAEAAAAVEPESVPAAPVAAEAASAQGGRASSAEEAMRERARVVEIMNACGAVRRLIPAGLAEELIASGAGVDAARERILKEIAARSAEEIVSTVSATGNGGANPLIADAMKRAGRKE